MPCDLGLWPCGAEPLDTLEGWVRDLFQPVRPGGTGLHPFPIPSPNGLPGLLQQGPVSGTPPGGGVPPAEKGEGHGAGLPGTAGPCDLARPWTAGSMYEVESVKDQHLLSLSWPLPCLHEHYRTKPHDYVSHLIGHGMCTVLFVYVHYRVMFLPMALYSFLGPSLHL